MNWGVEPGCTGVNWGVEPGCTGVNWGVEPGCTRVRILLLESKNKADGLLNCFGVE